MRFVLATGAMVAALALSACGAAAFGPDAQADGYTAAELAELLPAEAPDGWRIATDETDEGDDFAEDFGQGLSPLDPSAVTVPAGCAMPIKSDSIERAANLTLRSDGINAITALRDNIVVTVGVPRPGIDVFAEYRASLRRCSMFHVTALHGPVAFEIRQALFDPALSFAEREIGGRVTRLAEHRRARAYQIMLAQRGDVIVEAFASEYSTDIARGLVDDVLRKIEA